MRRTRQSSRCFISTKRRQTKNETETMRPIVAALLRMLTIAAGRPTRRSSATTSLSAAEMMKRRPGQVCSSRSRVEYGGSTPGGGQAGVGRATACPGLVGVLIRLESDDSRAAGQLRQPAPQARAEIATSRMEVIQSKLVKLPDTARFSTICIHAGQEPDPSTGAIITPIYQTSTYVQEEVGRNKGFEYARTQNPTRLALEQNIAAIEGGKAAYAFASGMAAIDAITTMLEAGDHVVVTDNTYGGTYRLFEQVLRRYQLSFRYVDTSRLDLVEQAIRPETKMLFIETPTNPVMRLTDLSAASALAHRHDVKVVVDNTFASPCRAAADRVRRRSRRPQHDEIPERPQRQRRRRRRGGR